MGPNANQPGGGQVPGQQSGRPLAPGEWPSAASAVPDWQQGLGMRGAPQPPVMPFVPPDFSNQELPPVSPVPPPQPLSPAPPLTPAPESLTPQNLPSPEPRKRLAATVLVVVMLVAIATSAAAGYFTFHNRPKPAPAKAPTHTQAGNFASINAIVFGLPNNLAAFKGDTGTTATYHVYATQDSTDTKACSLEFGTATPQELPGADAASIVDAQVESLKQAGATVTAPANGAALVVYATNNHRQTYNLATRAYSFTKDNQQVSVRYSLAVLKSGTRVIISRQCMNTGGPADQASLQKVEAAARQITIAKQ